MRIEEVIGRQVHERREALGLTQEQLGRQLEPLLGRPWSRQAVSAAEKGDRRFGAAELVALAAVLHAAIGDLLRPPVLETGIDLGGCDTIPRDVLLAVSIPGLSGSVGTPARTALEILLKGAVRLRDDADLFAALAYDVDSLLLAMESAP